MEGGLGRWRWAGVGQGSGVCRCGVDVVGYQVGDGRWGDVVDEGEGGEEEDCGGAIALMGEVGVGGGEGHVGGGEHESLEVRWGVRIFATMPGSSVGDIGGTHTPLLGLIPHPRTASITLPFSSSTSRTQSVFPVATTICVAHPFTCPYSFSSSSMLHFGGRWIVHVAQSSKQSSPSTAGST